MGKIEDVDIVNYMINQGATAKETAEYFGVSLSTIKKRLSFIKTQLKDGTHIKNDLLDLNNKNQEMGRKKGCLSHNSGAPLSEDMETIANHAIKVIADNLTLAEASVKFGIPSSTLHEHFGLLKNTEYHGIYEDLQSLFVYHQRSKNNIGDIRLFEIQKKYGQMLEELNINKKK